MKRQTDRYGKAMNEKVNKLKNKTKNIYIVKQNAQYFGLKTNLLQGLKEKWK